MDEQVFTNYRLLLPDREVLGTLVARDGRIADIQPGCAAQGQDGGGDYLLPGLIELHTDNLERCLYPRPGVVWPADSAVVWHDRELAGAGITTACAAVAIRATPGRPFSFEAIQTAVDALAQARQAGRLTADHRLHLRCELSTPETPDALRRLLDRPELTLISLMDHTPGQRQFATLEKFHRYYQGRYGLTRAQSEEYAQTLQRQGEQYAAANRAAVVEMATARGIPLASHDDATLGQARQAADEGVAIAEFPTTAEAASESHCCGLRVLAGAPNIILGGSHSGNVSSEAIARQGWLAILSSDYAPHSLLQALFLLAKRLDTPLYQVLALATTTPAQTIPAFADRGRLAVGLRADLLAVQDDGVLPCLRAVYADGRRVS